MRLKQITSKLKKSVNKRTERKCYRVSKDKSKLNIRQKKFAEYYVESGNVSQSAVKAGYSEKFAKSKSYLLLDNPLVVGYIQELNEELQDERIMNAKERQVVLSDIAQDKEADAISRIRAIDTLNKMTGEYTVKVDANVQQSEKLADVFAQISDNKGLTE